MRDKKYSRGSLFLYIVSGFIIAGTVAGVLFWQKIKYRLVDRQLTSAISDKSSGLYTLSYKNLIIDEVAGNVSVENVHLGTDSIVYIRQSRDRAAPDWIDIRIPKLIITGVKTPKALMNKKLEGGSIDIQSAVIELRPEKQKDSAAKQKDGTKLVDLIYQQVLGNLRSVQADSLLVHNLTFIVRDPESGKLRFNGSGFSCGLSDILIDSAHQNDSSRILFAKEIAVSCRDLSLMSRDKKYKYIFSGLDYNSPTRSFRVSKIRVEPQLSEADFAAAYTYSKDRLDFTLENVDIRNIDRFALFNERLIADSLVVGNSSFKIFRDVSHPHDSVDRTETYPQLALMKLGLPVNVRKLILTHAFLEYKEKNAKSDSSGKLQFFDVHAVFSNVTNIGAPIKENNKMLLDFSSRFLNKAGFHAKMVMLLQDPQGKFTLDAKLDKMDPVDLNPMLQPMALAKIDRGQIQGLSYHLDADKMHGIGKLTFLYSDLKVTLLKKDEAQNKYKTKLFSTFAAGLLVKKSNPDKGETRISRVDFPRDRHRSIFHMMWKSMFTAVKETAGMK
jgi:hypothetical protein